MNFLQLKRKAAKGELPFPHILKTENGYLVAYEIKDELRYFTAVNSGKVRCFAKLDSALAAASQVAALDTVFFRKSEIEVSVNE